MGTRVARNKLSKKFDLMDTPITLDKIGSKDDPCFSKKHDPRNSTCQRCGDAEICCIAMGQLNHMKRLKAEAEGNFKDIEEVTNPRADVKEIKKQVKKRIKELAARGKGMAEGEIVRDVHATFFTRGYTEGKIKKIIASMLDKGILTQSKKLIKYDAS